VSNIRTLPGVFPLHEDREFLSEREWVCLQLICRSRQSLAHAAPDELSQATANQIGIERAREIIHTAQIAQLDGLGSWIARLMAQAGLNRDEIRSLPAKNIMARVNRNAGYELCNAATVHALTGLQQAWRNTASSAEG